ncbi:MAG: putative immunity protein [Candidatus Saccharibacteria bacterium]
MKEVKETVELSMDELRDIAGYAAECAHRVLPIFEQIMPDDPRPRDAIEAALVFSKDGKRSNALRAKGFAGYKAARGASTPAAIEAGEAATQAIGAAYLHPLASAMQVKHILGAAAHAARAAELHAGDDRSIGVESCNWAVQHASSTVVAVLVRYPTAPAGGGRTGELLRNIDTALRLSAKKGA